jgi:hypothetical protein
MNRMIRINNQNQAVRFTGYQEIFHDNLLFRQVMCDQYLVPRKEWVPIPIESYHIQIILKAIAKNPEILKALHQEKVANKLVKVVSLERRYELSWLTPPPPKVIKAPAPKVSTPGKTAMKSTTKKPQPSSRTVKSPAAKTEQKKTKKPTRKSKPYVRRNADGDQLMDAMDYRFPGSYGAGRKR